MSSKDTYIKEYEEISQKLSDPQIASDFKKLKKLGQRQNEIVKIVQIIKNIEKIEQQIKENNDLEKTAFSDIDEELALIAKEENITLKKKLTQLNKQYKKLVIPKDPHDERNVILEIRAGAGGDEAGLFAGELFRMYSHWAENNTATVSVYNSNKNELGGIKEIIAQISGKEIYGKLKFESGVHRVQRIPETEKSGRVHTSTVTVAILPEAQEKDLKIKTEEVKIDTFRSSGPGGQSVNTTDSAIRLTHLPTGIVVSCQDEKSQHKNKAKAFSILRSKLLQKQREDEQKKIANLRSSQIGTGDRSEKIRTYNFPQDRITDHRLKKSWYGIQKILDGNINELIKDLKEFEVQLKMKINNF
jgi:peptide chain release factor 1